MPNQTIAYTRERHGSPEKIAVTAYLHEHPDEGDEIRVIRTIGDEVADDQIAYHPGDGKLWLEQQHDAWLAEGYTLASQSV